MRPDRQESNQPPSAEHLFHQATIHEEEGSFERALADCDAAIAATHSFLADAHNVRGIILEELGWRVDAIGAYRLALGLDPTLDEAATNLDEAEDETEAEYAQAGLEGEVEEPDCPICASSDVRIERFAIRAVFVSWWFIGAPLPFVRRRWRCVSCGHRWRI